MLEIAPFLTIIISIEETRKWITLRTFLVEQKTCEILHMYIMRMVHEQQRLRRRLDRFEGL
jgi:hypothetical protein